MLGWIVNFWRCDQGQERRHLHYHGPVASSTSTRKAEGVRDLNITQLVSKDRVTTEIGG